MPLDAPHELPSDGTALACLAAESAAIIWMRIQRFQPECGRFEDQCRTVLYHYAIDVWRCRKRSPVQPAVGGEGPNLALEAAARQLTQGELSRDASWRAELSQHVQWLLPWHPGEQQAGLKRDWPPLKTVWKGISTAIGDPAVKIEAELLCRTIAPLLPPGTQLTPDVWNQWVRRAKDQARTQVGDEAVWARVVSTAIDVRCPMRAA